MEDRKEEAKRNARWIAGGMEKGAVRLLETKDLANEVVKMLKSYNNECVVTQTKAWKVVRVK